MSERVEEGTYYQGQRCGNCCRWPWFVKVGEREIHDLSAQLGLSEDEFIQEYTCLRPQRDGLALTDKPNGECIFLEDKRCTVQAVKPDQCRAFHNGWNFPG